MPTAKFGLSVCYARPFFPWRPGLWQDHAGAAHYHLSSCIMMEMSHSGHRFLLGEGIHRARGMKHSSPKSGNSSFLALQSPLSLHSWLTHLPRLGQKDRNGFTPFNQRKILGRCSWRALLCLQPQLHRDSQTGPSPLGQGQCLCGWVLPNPFLTQGPGMLPWCNQHQSHQ